MGSGNHQGPALSKLLFAPASLCQGPRVVPAWGPVSPQLPPSCWSAMGKATWRLSPMNPWGFTVVPWAPLHPASS